MTEQIEHIAPSAEGADVQLLFSNLNLQEGTIALGGVETLQRILSDINGDGFAMHYEITPTRRLALEARLRKFDTPHEERLAGRVHQTWPEGPIRGTRHAPSARAAVINSLAWIMMPETRRSRKTIGRISGQLDNATAIVYADQKDRHGQLTDFYDVGALRAVPT